MTDYSMPFTEILSKVLSGDGERTIQLLLQKAMQTLIDLEAASKIKAEKYERSPERTTSRNGSRERELDTAAGTLHLRIPKLRTGTFFPSVLEPRRTVDKALVSVIQEAYINGVSTRKLDDIGKAMGLDGTDKSQVSRVCKELTQGVEQFRNRPLDTTQYAYVWFDATYLKVRENGRVLNRAYWGSRTVASNYSHSMAEFLAKRSRPEGRR